jgi:hypothetical protein
MSDEEVVLTSRRALWRIDGGRWAAGRLRLTDRRVQLLPHDGDRIEVLVAEVSSVRIERRPRPVLVLGTPDGALRIRCFAASAVAALLVA